MAESNQCPVCRARFRGVSICSRCGADLQPLMVLAAQSWWLRESARRSLAAGDLESAAEFAQQAEQLQSTPNGEALQLLTFWLSAGSRQVKPQESGPAAEL